jgi:TatD DNase family protein
MKINYFDIHSHLESSKFDKDREDIISDMQKEGVFTIAVGTSLEESKKVVQLADKYENIFASVGLHPTDVKEDFKEEDYIELVQNPKVVAIGECGLEFFRLEENIEDNIKSLEKQRQINIFEKQIDFAVKYNKPLMIHCRDAHTEVLDILNKKKKEHRDILRGNVHFFSGDKIIAKKYFDLDFTVSFTGVITFADSYDEVVKFAPLDKIMSETDSPYVAPIPFRGQRNSPLYVKEVVKKIAEIRNEDYSFIKNKMVENAIKFFNLKLS